MLTLALAALLIGSCSATPVHDRRISAPPLGGMLFGGEVVDGGLAVYVGGRNPNGSNEKILWIVPQKVRAKAGAQLALTGRLGGVVLYRSRWWGASSAQTPGLLFPSIIRFPQAGCWTLTLTTGRIKAKLVVLAQDLPGG